MMPAIDQPLDHLMNSVIGYLANSETRAPCLHQVLGEDSQVEKIGEASVAVSGPRSSLASGAGWLCGLSGSLDNHPELASRTKDASVSAHSPAAVVGSIVGQVRLDREEDRGRILAVAGNRPVGLVVTAMAVVVDEPFEGRKKRRARL